MKCPKCQKDLKKVEVEVEDAESRVISYQCPECDYFSFEPESSLKVIEELKTKESPLRIKQKIIKLSQDRLGMYFNRDVVKSLGLKPGEEIFVSVPDKKKIVVSVG